MIVAKVIDTLISTRKHLALQGMKLLVVEPVGKAGAAFIAGDLLGAGVGEYVLVTRGSSAASAADNKTAPVDAMVTGILDQPPAFAKSER